MQKWEAVLLERYERDRTRILDYSKINLELREWLIELLYKEVTDNERSEHGTDDDPVHDDRIRDRKRVRTEQDQEPDPGPDLQTYEWTEAGAAEIGIAAAIAAEPSREYLIDEDIYDSFYDEIVEMQNLRKVKPKKKHYKKKG